MLTNEAGQPIQLEPHWQLYSLKGERLPWSVARYQSEAWHRRGGRGKGTDRTDRAVTRGITLTEAGREYLASLRAGVK